MMTCCLFAFMPITINEAAGVAINSLSKTTTRQIELNKRMVELEGKK